MFKNHKKIYLRRSSVRWEDNIRIDDKEVSGIGLIRLRIENIGELRECDI